ncbi:MAG: S1 RNA-binding domain-containing protein [Candidatus Liptonbacteria bacterium]|nr:S1 RNA-binding domain-containing protein [Candidatus Liptonbacteria bacterium]
MIPTVEEINKTSAGGGLVEELKNELQTADWPKEGAVVEAILMKKLSREAYFDLGRFGTGIVYGVEFLNAKEQIRGMKPKDKVSAKIVNVDGERGFIELSLAEAGRQKIWQQVKDLAESGEVIKVKVMAANAGGLTVSIPDSEFRAFLPVSQLSLDHYPRVLENDRQKIADELKKFIGQELGVKIIDVNPRSNKIIASEREVLSANVKELLSKYSVGQVVGGVVSGVADFGVFVRFTDNPEIEGMIHISELDHRLVDNPKEIVKVSDELNVKIVDIKEGKVFLSLKALKDDPWAHIEEKYKAGQDTAGTLYKLNPFGAVINLEGGLQGLIHISEFGGQNEMRTALMPDTQHQFVIDAVRPEEKRIILKLKK